MTKSALAISLAVLLSINAAAHSQSIVGANPVFEGTRASRDGPLDERASMQVCKIQMLSRCILGPPFLST